MKAIKNIEHETVLSLKDQLEYEEGKVSSLTLAMENNVRMTIMAFDEGCSIASHKAGGDAMVQVLEGSVEITIDGKQYTLHEGETIIMPKGLPHALKSLSKYKMLLTVVFPTGE